MVSAQTAPSIPCIITLRLCELLSCKKPIINLQKTAFGLAGAAAIIILHFVIVAVSKYRGIFEEYSSFLRKHPFGNIVGSRYNG